MPGPHNFVSVEIRCNGCGETMRFCGHTDRNVPGKIRCTPTGGGGGGRGNSEIRCPGCGRFCFGSTDDLNKAIAAEVRGPWDRHIKAGAVILSC